MKADKPETASRARSGPLRLLFWRKGAAAGETAGFDDNLAAWHVMYIVGAALAVASLLVREPLLFLAAVLVAIVGVVPELWYRYVPEGLRLTQRPAQSRAMFGDIVEMDVSIENHLPLPLPWVHLRDEAPEALPFERVRLAPTTKNERAILDATLALWAYQRVRRKYRVLASARGPHEFGPATLGISDPFGLLIREYTREARSVLLVHPPVVPLEWFGLDPIAPFGQIRSKRKLLEDPLFTNGIRPYISGDEPRRIHWKATARTGELQSKVYEPSARHTVAIFVDVRTVSNISLGSDRTLAELAIACAASVADWAMNEKYSVGLYSNGTLSAAREHDAPQPDDPTPSQQSSGSGAAYAQLAGAVRLRIPPSSRAEHLPRLLDGLARLLPYFGMPMDLLVSLEERQLPKGATIIFIGNESVVDVPLIIALRRAREHGYDVSLLLTESDTIGGMDDEGKSHLVSLSVHHIGGQHRWHEITTGILGSDANRRATDGPAAFSHTVFTDTGGKQGANARQNGAAREPERAGRARVPSAFTIK